MNILLITPLHRHHPPTLAFCDRVEAAFTALRYVPRRLDLDLEAGSDAWWNSSWAGAFESRHRHRHAM
jgi:hypothetical protein